MSFFGNDDPPQAPYYPPIPPKEELMDVIDKISGTQTITVTGADGKKRRVMERLPRTPEEQKLFDDAGELMDKSMAEIKRLNEYNPTEVIDFAPFVNVMNDLNKERKSDIAELSKLPDFNRYVEDFKTMGNTILQEEFQRQENETQEYLNRRGYGDSTAAAESRSALGYSKAKALNENNVNANLYGEKLKSEDLTNRSNMYNFREQGRMGQLQRAQTEHQLKLDQKAQLDNARQTALQNQAGLFTMGAKIRGDDTATAMASRAPELGNTIFQQSNMDSLNRHQLNLNQINSRYQNEMEAYNSRPPGFGDFLLNAGIAGGAAMLTGHPGSVAGKFGSKLFGV